MLSLPGITKHQHNHATFISPPIYRISQKWHYSKLR